MAAVALTSCSSSTPGSGPLSSSELGHPLILGGACAISSSACAADFIRATSPETQPSMAPIRSRLHSSRASDATQPAAFACAAGKCLFFNSLTNARIISRLSAPTAFAPSSVLVRAQSAELATVAACLSAILSIPRSGDRMEFFGLSSSFVPAPSMAATLAIISAITTRTSFTSATCPSLPSKSPESRRLLLPNPPLCMATERTEPMTLPEKDIPRREREPLPFFLWSPSELLPSTTLPSSAGASCRPGNSCRRRT
mmetsp:Transcript_2944/g.5283  ORF Transcript_2944/g.5283 Transcript_2944/m.5283 type:complete len:256 (-) Transcript_2944:456-1223(-)